MFEAIINALKAIWSFIKKIVLKVVSFVMNIVSFFRDEKRLEKLKADKDLIAVAIKERLATGNYQVVNCLFNKETDTIDEEDAVVISADGIDEETESKFGTEDMIVLT